MSLSWKSKHQQLQKEYENLQQSHSFIEQKLKIAEKETHRVKELQQNESQREDREIQKELDDLHHLCDSLMLDKTQLEHEYQKNKNQLTQEIERLNAALQESEDRLKESEEIAWKNKAEAGELLWAYQTDQEKLQRLQQSLQECESQKEILLSQQMSYVQNVESIIGNLSNSLNNGEHWEYYPGKKLSNDQLISSEDKIKQTAEQLAMLYQNQSINHANKIMNLINLIDNSKIISLTSPSNKSHQDTDHLRNKLCTLLSSYQVREISFEYGIYL